MLEISIFQSRHFPETVDINLTGACNLACTFCWGPPHETGDVIQTEEWKSILHGFREQGTQGVVLTGGEPLLRKDTAAIAAYAKSLGLQVTLSTNGMFHEALGKVLPFVDRVGIPLDGSTAKLNARMRLGSPKHFDLATGAMKMVKGADKYLTVRTVVSRVNYQDIRDTGILIQAFPFEVDRWKLYEFTPTGAYGKLSSDEHGIDSQTYLALFMSMQQEFPSLNVVGLPQRERAGRYVFVMPNGNVSGVEADGITYIHLGNVMSGIEAIAAALHAIPIE